MDSVNQNSKINRKKYSDGDVAVYVRAAQKALLESVTEDQHLSSAMSGIFRGVRHLAEEEYPAPEQSEERSNREIIIFEKILNPILGWGDSSETTTRISSEQAWKIEEKMLQLIELEL